jgi:Tfp pilus assembly protein PilF
MPKYSRKAIELDPSNALAHNNLANLLMKGGDLGEAEKEIREAIRIARKLSHVGAWLCLN